MNPVEIILKKRNGQSLEASEIQWFIQGVINGTVTDYQAAAFLMAVYFQGLNVHETQTLTQEMLDSGTRYSLESIEGPKIDKHSTGGVGDKVSLILAPLGAACGLKVPMMSGRALGHTGGTLDKLESIPGFRHSLSRSEFETVLKKVGCAMIGQDESIAPADRKLYALRDVTGTVECLPLIVSSILSKKAAEGAEGLILDIKVGSGAFMKTKRDAKALGKSLVQVAKKLGLNAKAVITDMNQPLGYAVGNSVEVNEAIEILKNQRSSSFSSTDLKEVTIHLCSHMLILGKKVRTVNEGRKRALEKLQDGRAWEVFKQMVIAQGGDLQNLNQESGLPVAQKKIQWKSRRNGYLTKINTEAIGRLIVAMGGGRQKAEDQIDHSVGLLFHRKLGARLKPGDPIVTALVNPSTSEEKLAELEQRFLDSVQIQSTRKNSPKLILETLS